MKLEDIKIDMTKEPVDKESWDLERWRKENPMDYLKALSLLEEAEHPLVKNEVFKSIYRVIQLHVPTTLYKYCSLSDDDSLNMKKFETLNDGSIYMADIESFNDPFDGKGFYYDPRKLADIERLEDCDGRLIDDFTRFLRGASLTAIGVQSMPMWAHYGSNHAGYCVAYDMEKNVELKACTAPIQYTDERLDITSLMKEQAIKISEEIERQQSEGKKEIRIDDLTLVFMLPLLCNLKNSSWSYEKEFRCTIGVKPGELPYIEAKPKEIYIGMKCAPLHEVRLKEIGASWSIPVYKMIFDECAEEHCLIAERV